MKSPLKIYREWQEKRKVNKEFSMMAHAYYRNFLGMSFPHQQEVSAFQEYLIKKEGGEIAQPLDGRHWRRHLARFA